MQRRLDELAVDIGRLHRRLSIGRGVSCPHCGEEHRADSSELDIWTLEQIGRHVLDLSGMLEPTAAELVGCVAPYCPDAVAEAVLIVDKRAATRRRTLGLEAPA
jgi:hypothetical protein